MLIHIRDNAQLEPRETVVIDHKRECLAEDVKAGYLVIMMNSERGFALARLEAVELPESYYAIPRFGPWHPVLYQPRRRPQSIPDNCVITERTRITPWRQVVDGGLLEAPSTERPTPLQSATTPRPALARSVPRALTRNEIRPRITGRRGRSAEQRLFSPLLILHPFPWPWLG